MKLPKFEITDCFTVLGTRGTGKSSLAREIAKKWDRVVIIDPVADWTDGEIFTDYPTFARRLTELKKERKKNFRLIFRFHPDEKHKAEVFESILKICFHFHNLQIVIDEIQLFATTQFIPEYLKNILFIGRHNKISLICITQRPGQLNKNILAQSLHVMVGQLHERNDLRVVSDFLNVEQDRIINLPKGRFFHFSPGEEIREIQLFKNEK